MMVRGPKSSQDSRKFQSHLQEKLETYKETIRIIFKYMKVHDGLQYLVWPQGNNTHEWNVQGNSFLSQHKGKWDAWENWGLHDLWSGMLQRRFLGINSVVGINFFVFFFIVIQFQLSLFFPHYSPLPCPAHPHLPHSILPITVVFVHESFIHFPWLDPSISFPCCPPPLSLMATVSLFFISMSLLLFCLLVCFVD